MIGVLCDFLPDSLGGDLPHPSVPKGKERKTVVKNGCHLWAERVSRSLPPCGLGTLLTGLSPPVDVVM